MQSQFQPNAVIVVEDHIDQDERFLKDYFAPHLTNFFQPFSLEEVIKALSNATAIKPLDLTASVINVFRSSLL